MLKFESALYPCRSALLDAVASSYLDVSPSEVRAALETYSDAELARDCMMSWGLDIVMEDHAGRDWSQLIEWDVDSDDLAQAFGRFRQEVAANEAEATTA